MARTEDFAFCLSFYSSCTLTRLLKRAFVPACLSGLLHSCASGAQVFSSCLGAYNCRYRRWFGRDFVYSLDVDHSIFCALVTCSYASGVALVLSGSATLSFTNGYEWVLPCRLGKRASFPVLRGFLLTEA